MNKSSVVGGISFFGGTVRGETVKATKPTSVWVLLLVSCVMFFSPYVSIIFHGQLSSPGIMAIFYPAMYRYLSYRYHSLSFTSHLPKCLAMLFGICFCREVK